MKCKKLNNIEISSAYFGYIRHTDVNKHIYPIDKETKDNDIIYAVCEIGLYDLRSLNGSDHNPKCFDFFLGYEDPKNGVKIRSSVFYWRNLMGMQIGSEKVWLISEDIKEVYLMHEWKSILYFLGKVKDDHPLKSACIWRYKRIK